MLHHTYEAVYSLKVGGFGECPFSLTKTAYLPWDVQCNSHADSLRRKENESNK